VINRRDSESEVENAQREERILYLAKLEKINYREIYVISKI